MNRSIIVGILIASAVTPTAASGQTSTVYSSLPLSGEMIVLTLAFDYKAFTKSTTFTTLTVKGVPPGSPSRRPGWCRR
jgi:hypothetical protein